MTKDMAAGSEATTIRPAPLYHIIGIGGIGMSAIAEIMLARGLRVQGSDLQDGQNARRLREKGIPVFTGHDAANLGRASHVVISSAIKPGNPELDVAQAKGLTIFRRADMLAELMRDARAISVTGTHGKTTTTSLIAWSLEQAGIDPTVINGGIINAWGSNARIGTSDWMVVEADESDGTFTRLPTRIGVVTNIDPEHLDHYGSEAALHDEFRRFFAQIPEGGAVVAGIDHPVVRRLVGDYQAGAGNGSGPRARVLGYGRAEDADVRLVDACSDGGSMRFDVALSDKIRGGARQLTNLRLAIPGDYNLLNALATIAAASEVGLADSAIALALASFGGVARRFSRMGEWNGVAIYDDYAHHPVEIAAVLHAARGFARGRVIAIAQPHRYSRLKSLFAGFSTCFADADIVLIAPVYAAGETANGLDHQALAEAVQATGKSQVLTVADEDAIVETVAMLAHPGDLVIGLGAGNITEWNRALPGRLAALSEAAPSRLGAAL